MTELSHFTHDGDLPELSHFTHDRDLPYWVFWYFKSDGYHLGLKADTTTILRSFESYSSMWEYVKSYDAVEKLEIDKTHNYMGANA